MFTLEDIDLAEDLEFIREHAGRFLPEDVRADSDGHTGRREEAHQDASDQMATGVVHPYDYLITD